ncbi:MAG TPA: hypothetical protein VG870_02350 [Chitinophagaceae bacterium]|nr:hypothetical protein [Chitinophagaceae bacterium]
MEYYTIDLPDTGLRPLEAPVPFYCRVNDRALTARLVALVDHPVHPAFRIAFSDGCQDNFYVGESGAVVGEQGLTPYAAAIGDDLLSLLGFQGQGELYSLRWNLNGFYINIWVIGPRSGDPPVYKVYFQRHCRLELRKSGAGWEYRCAANLDPGTGPEKLAAEIGRLIDREHAAA